MQFQRHISKYPVVAKIVRDKRFFALGGHVGTLDNYFGVQSKLARNLLKLREKCEIG